MQPRAPRTTLNPWLLILLTALVPLAGFLFFFYKWYHDRTDYRRMASYFIERQNSVLAFDANSVAVGFGDLLEKAGRDAKILSVITPTADNFKRFYNAQIGDFTRFDAKNDALVQSPLPFYNRLRYLNAKGEILLDLRDGAIDSTQKSIQDCKESELCDHKLLERSLRLKPGQAHFGSVLRYYSPKNVPEEFSGAGLSVAYRAEKGIFILTIDYRHLKDHLTTPAFPYDPKRDLLDAYKKENYLYIVDKDYNIITHPNYWDALGIDKSTGKWVPPMKDDSEAGKRPINISAYQSGVLKEYFDRLLRTSFTQKGVDIFRAPNLAGATRILSVAPIVISFGQYNESNVFGHVVISCNIDYFEAPKAAIIPYY